MITRKDGVYIMARNRVSIAEYHENESKIRRILAESSKENIDHLNSILYYNKYANNRYIIDIIRRKKDENKICNEADDNLSRTAKKDKYDIEYAYHRANHEFDDECTEAHVEARKARQNLKRSQVKQAKCIIEDAIGKRISVRDFSNEITDNGVSPDDFIKESAKEYKHEINEKKNQREFDTNHDGKIDDDDDVILSPGMRKLMRYM